MSPSPAISALRNVIRPARSALIVAARQKLLEKKIQVRIVSMPSWELFEAQPLEYRHTVLPPAVDASKVAALVARVPRMTSRERTAIEPALMLVLSAAVVVIETTNAKLRLFRVPDLLSAAFILATLALLSKFLFR